MVKNDIQNYPTSDSPNHDAFEGIVELYYEIKGYITSSGKWFWKKADGKQQRGYQDIDVLAINGNETIIVSVSSNFDDKFSFSQGELNIEKAYKTLEYFNRVSEYLKATEQYNWLASEHREIKKVLAVINTPNIEKFQPFLKDNQIEIHSVDKMIKEISEYLDTPGGMKIQNQTLRILQILKYEGLDLNKI
jgi:hypothetical protein